MEKISYDFIYMYIYFIQIFGISLMFKHLWSVLLFFWIRLKGLKVSYVNQGCIYLIKNTVKTVIFFTGIFLQFKNKCSLFQYIWMYFCDAKLHFQHHYSRLQCHMILEIINMLISCSKNISYYYQCWKQLRWLIVLLKLWYIFLFFLMNWDSINYVK